MPARPCSHTAWSRRTGGCGGRPLLIVVPTVVATVTGCVLLIVLQWPFAVTLTLAILSWLITVAIAATVVSEL